ncbi:DsbA family oxidoreductase [Pseudoxanthomonas jiangsuensis]|uniref:DsbA family oxidoreductase n=1 Tax=Pseudoxanthomonas jiangsuensis TaxID=619688 RepID=UPI0013917251|nr:DsbA family oxidoreductase [Pseudoxanthomonas jiangsuensis]
MNRIIIEIWSDLVCPWCWIGKRKLEQALTTFEHADRVQVEHRAFRLMPGLGAQPSRTMLLARLGSPQRADEMLAHVEAEAAKVGLAYRLADTWIGDTVDLHRLVKLAASRGVGDAAIERFYRAGFTDNEAVFEPATQVRLMREVGLERNEIDTVLTTDAYAAEVEQDQQALLARGQQGVPFFLINGRQAVSGGQPLAVFLQALQGAWASQGPATADVAVCSPAGCDVTP